VAIEGKLGIQRREHTLIGRHVVLREDGLRGTLRDTDRAVDALARVDGEEGRALAEGVDRTDLAVA
jgi:hypothetical protein